MTENKKEETIYQWVKGMETELKQYREIGTIEEFKALKEKSVAKKPTKAGIGYKCVCCGSYTDPRDWHSAYCGRCGQKMDWNVGKEDTVQNIGYADQSGLMSAT